MDLQPIAEQSATSFNYLGWTFCNDFNPEGPLVSYTAQIRHLMLALLMGFNTYGDNSFILYFNIFSSQTFCGHTPRHMAVTY